jgi:hypothetical protein
VAAIGHHQAKGDEMAPAAGTASAEEQVKLAAKAYIYGYPLVYNLREAAGFVVGEGRFPVRADYNEFGHVRELAGPDLKFVSPNNDTCYSIAICDVRQGPLVLHVPDTAGRYYVLQFIDAWTNNFAYIGKRATGTAEGEFLLVPHDYDGPGLEGMRVVHAPSGMFVILGRVQVDGEADLHEVRALQDQFTLTPLVVRQGGVAPAPAAGAPVPDARVGEDLEWWERLRVELAAFPPPAADTSYLKMCEGLGLTASESPYIEPDPALAAILTAGAEAGQATIEELLKHTQVTPEGWQVSPHVFDYNLDYLELGTIDAPEWKNNDRTEAYAMRAVTARGGLWGNHGYEATYCAVWVDSQGDPLEGSHRYEFRLEASPPVDAFWSLTMYEVPEFYLVANPIDRYSVGDRTPGLVYGDDGSLTIYLQKDSPGPERESNWLPTPVGAFRPLLRLYEPRKEILEGAYVLPAIEKVG